MNKILLIVIVTFLSGCDSSDKISQLEQEVVRQQIEITTKTDELKNTKLQLEQVNKELDIAAKRSDTASAKIEELETKINNVTEDLGKEGMILPACLIGQSIIIYTKPYDDVQIFIGVVQEIKHADKVTLYSSQTNQPAEVPFSNIIGYRMLK